MTFLFAVGIYNNLKKREISFNLQLHNREKLSFETINRQWRNYTTEKYFLF